MASCEPLRCSAYSEDLRWRMVWQRQALGYTYQKVAENLGVDKSTVYRTLQLFESSGSVEKRKYPKENAFRKLTTPAQLLILNLVVQKPGIYLHEMQRSLHDMLMIDVDLSTICRFLKDNGLTRQKLHFAAAQRDELLRQQYSSDVSVYSSEMLIFVDETGADRRNLLRKHAYSIRGKPMRDYALLARGEHISAIGIMSSAGLLDVGIVKGGTDGDAFYNVIQTHLLPHLMPFNGINPHSVVILDNCAIHHTNEVVSMIEEVGAIVQFLPPYSPDLMPIEGLFGKVKQTLRSLESDMEDITDLDTLLLAAFASVTEEDCIGYINESGIYSTVVY